MNARLVLAALLLLGAPASASARGDVVGSAEVTIGPLPAEVVQREVEKRLIWRLGAAALAAGFSDDWTDAQLERAMAAAVTTREGAGKPAVQKTDAEMVKAAPTATGAHASKQLPPKVQHFEGPGLTVSSSYSRSWLPGGRVPHLISRPRFRPLDVGPD